MADNTFTLNVTDSNGSIPQSARAYFLDAAKQPIVVAGEPVFTEFYKSSLALGNGTVTALKATFTNALQSINVRVTSPGYADKMATLAPGTNEVKLETAQAASMKSNGKALVVFIVVVVLVYLFYKYGFKK